MTKQHFLPKAVEIFNATLPESFNDFKFVHNDSIILFTLWSALHMTATDVSLYLGVAVAGATLVKKGVEIYLLIRKAVKPSDSAKETSDSDEGDK